MAPNCFVNYGNPFFPATKINYLINRVNTHGCPATISVMDLCLGHCRRPCQGTDTINILILWLDESLQRDPFAGGRSRRALHHSCWLWGWTASRLQAMKQSDSAALDVNTSSSSQNIAFQQHWSQRCQEEMCVCSSAQPFPSLMAWHKGSCFQMLWMAGDRKKKRSVFSLLN